MVSTTNRVVVPYLTTKIVTVLARVQVDVFRSSSSRSRVIGTRYTTLMTKVMLGADGDVFPVARWDIGRPSVLTSQQTWWRWWQMMRLSSSSFYIPYRLCVEMEQVDS